MSITERLQFIITASGADAAKEFRQLGNTASTEMAKVEGAAGKGSAALGFLKSNAGNLAVAGGAAVSAFAAKAVGEFQGLALEVGKFSDATGVSTAAASQWIEVAGDLGIESGKVSGALLKMEKAAGTNPAAFERFGIAIAKTSSGAVDANETFIRTIERLNAIKDPAERAAVGTQLLGKSWSELGEIINSADIRGQLDSVSDAKIIDRDELQRARDFRDAWDELKGKLEDFALTVGGEVVPALTEVMTTLGELGNIANDAGGFFGAIFRTGVDDIQWLREQLGLANDGADKWIEAARDTERINGANAARWQGLADAAGMAAEGIDQAGAAAEDAATETDKLNDAYDRLLKRLDDQRSLMELQDGFAEVGTKAAEAMEKADKARELTQKAYKSGSEEMAADAAKAWDAANEAARDLEYTVLDNKEAVIQYGKEVLALPEEQITKILADLDDGEYDNVLRKLELLEKTRTVSVNVQAGKTSASSFMNPAELAKALGPNFSLGGDSPIYSDGGGRGNRVVRPPSGSSPLFELAGLSGGGTIPVSSGPTPSDLLAAIGRLSGAQDAVGSSAEDFAEVTQQAWERAVSSGGDFASSQKDVTNAALKSARAASDLAAAQAMLEGKTLSAKEQARIQQEELRKLAAQVGIDSPLAAGMRNYIDLLDKVGLASEDSTQASKDAAEALERRTEAALAQAGADLEAARATQGVAAAQNELIAALFSKAKTAEEAQQRAEAIARAEQSLVDAVLQQADALAEQRRNAAAAAGITLTESDVASLKLATIQAESSKLLPGTAKAALDAYANTLQNSISLTLNVQASDPLSGRLIFETLDREMRLRGLGGLATV